MATSVDLVRDVVGPRPAGFVNAVLRRVATRDLEAWLEIAAPGSRRRPRRATSRSATATRGGSSPRCVEALGGSLAETEAALAADSERPAVTLCAVPGLAGAAELAAAGAAPARWSEFGAYLAEGDPAGIPAVAQGRAGVQDEASQLAAIALTRVHSGGVHRGGAGGVPGSDHRWLDLCAGPGGKARLLGGLAAQQGARLVAAEIRPHRARLVRSARPAPPRPTLPRPAQAGARPAWWWPTGRGRPGRRAPSTGSSPTSRAPGSAPCAAAPRPAGGVPRRPSPTWPACSGAC